MRGPVVAPSTTTNPRTCSSTWCAKSSTSASPRSPCTTPPSSRSCRSFERIATDVLPGAAARPCVTDCSTTSTARCAAPRRRRAVQERARHHLAAVGPHRARRRHAGAQLLRQQLPRPRRPPRRRSPRPHEALDRYGYGMASVRFICGTQTVHKELEARLVDVPRHRRHDPLLVVLRRQRRPVRDAARRAGRDHLRRAQPRLDHRRHPPVQGPALPLRQQRHGRARAASCTRPPARATG